MPQGATVPSTQRTDVVSVVVADDHPVVLRGLEAMIEEAEGMTVVATAREGEDAVRRVLALHPQVVVMDLRMPGCDGIEATRRILAEQPDTRVIILSAEENGVVAEALQAGAVGYLSKKSIADTLLDGIRQAARGEAVVSAELVSVLVRSIRHSPEASPLSGREREILTLVAEGKTNEHVARAMGTSVSTVKSLLAGVFEKLGATDRASALAACFRRGWLT